MSVKAIGGTRNNKNRDPPNCQLYTPHLDEGCNDFTCRTTSLDEANADDDLAKSVRKRFKPRNKATTSYKRFSNRHASAPLERATSAPFRLEAKKGAH